MRPRRTRRRQQVLVGQKIRELRKARNLTQHELACRIGVQQSDLCRMETGEYKVSLDTLFRILAVFSMNFGEFFEELPATSTLSADEAALLEIYRRLTPDQREELLGRLRPEAPRNGDVNGQ